MEKNPNYQNILESKKGVYDFKWIHCSNDILVSVGHPDLLTTGTVSNPKAVKRGISQALSGISKAQRLACPRKKNNIYYSKIVPILKNIRSML